MENLNYKNESVEKNFVKKYAKGPIFKEYTIKNKEYSFRITKYFIELKGRELKDRKVTIKRGIKELLFKPIIVSIDDMNKSKK